MLNKTGKLKTINIERPQPRARDTDTLDLGAMRPWRIALWITQLDVQLIFDLSGQVMLGRRDQENNSVPHVDLTPFRAEELGVSRGHLTLSLEGNTVMVMDNHSLNGTHQNGKFLQPGQPYTLKNGDELMLGMMTIQVELLVNPLDQ
jgi:pSer/pThr/pTyr-binding forkhead associated (FHA) protein